MTFLKMFLAFRKEFKLTRKKGYEYAQRKMKKLHEKRAHQLFDLAVSMGGVLIKLCQYLSTRRDFLPEPYLKILSALQDAVPPVDFSEIRSVIEEEYVGKEFPFAAIEEIPLASASLGQVHKAVLKDSREVVLKILRPSIESVIDIDFAILYYVFHFASNFKFLKDSKDFFKLLDEFIRVTGDELNFEREIYVSKQFRQHMRKFDYLRIPEVYEEYCTKRIIVMEYIKGDKVTNIEAWKARNNDPIVISRRIIEMYAEQFLFMRVIHFDPHPGNILVLDDNNIALLDFGMAGEISESMSKGIKDGLASVVKKDYRKIVSILKDMGFIKKDADVAIFLPVVEYFFEEVFETIKLDRESMQKINLTPVINDLIEILYSQPFQLPVEWAYIGKTVGIVTGIIASLNPDFDIYEEFKPYFELAIKKNREEIAHNAAETIKNLSKDMLALPSNINQYIEKSEKRFLKMHQEQEELAYKIASVSDTFRRGILFCLCFISAGAAYFFYSSADIGAMFVSGGLSVLFFALFLVLKKREKGDILRRHLRRW